MGTLEKYRGAMIQVLAELGNEGSVNRRKAIESLTNGTREQFTGAWLTAFDVIHNINPIYDWKAP